MSISNTKTKCKEISKPSSLVISKKHWYCTRKYCIDNAHGVSIHFGHKKWHYNQVQNWCSAGIYFFPLRTLWFDFTSLGDF